MRAHQVFELGGAVGVMLSNLGSGIVDLYVMEAEVGNFATMGPKGI